MKYKMCFRTVSDGPECYLPEYAEGDFASDDLAKYFALARVPYEGEKIPKYLRDRLDDKLENYNGSEDFVFWIFNEETQEYVYKNPIEDEPKWIVLSYLMRGENEE